MIAFRPTPSESTDQPSMFEPGQIVFHKRYRYRGLIVQRDDQCQADDAWYDKNQTQPDRSQPWYHLLVDGSSACTYVAAVNIRLGNTTTPISHPLLSRFFSGFVDGRYRRNDVPWPTL